MSEMKSVPTEASREEVEHDVLYNRYKHDMTAHRVGGETEIHLHGFVARVTKHVSLMQARLEVMRKYDRLRMEQRRADSGKKTRHFAPSTF